MTDIEDESVRAISQWQEEDRGDELNTQQITASVKNHNKSV